MPPEVPPGIDPSVLALGVRQPWVELILRGTKRIEVRSRSTQVRGLIYIYSSKKLSDHPAAAGAISQHAVAIPELPLGLLVGSVELTACAPLAGTPMESAESCLPKEILTGSWGWRFANPIRFPKPIPVRFLPYGIWFYPFRRRGEASQPL